MPAVAVDQMQILETAVNEMKSESTINWVKDPFGRAGNEANAEDSHHVRRPLSNFKQTGQFQRIFGVLEDRTKAIIQEHNANFQSLQVVGDLSTKLVSDAARLSYVTLEEVVHTLLQIENGKTRLSRENSSVLDLLHTTVEKFQDICGTSKHSAADIGLEAETCMRLGDNAHRFLGDFTDAMRTLNIESAAIWKVREQESVGTDILNFFDSGVSQRAEQRCREAAAGVNENEARIREKERKALIYYQLAMAARNTSAGILMLHRQVDNVAKEYDVDFRRVTDELTVANTLWEGLMNLKNVIWATDLYTTRDNALRVILQLLETDDEVFHREPFYEDTQVRIQDAICAKLGNDAVLKLQTYEPELIENGLSDL
ncbi:hypothetical protein N7528_008221 [Penicillium herquei]|nr:hypothetical protein N7528_008221 [Penicillium herquei]